MTPDLEFVYKSEGPMRLTPHLVKPPQMERDAQGLLTASIAELVPLDVVEKLLSLKEAVQ